MALMNEEMMSPYERLKVSYKLYDKKQKEHIKGLREIIDKQNAKIEELKETINICNMQIDELKSLTDESALFEAHKKLLKKNDNLKKQIAVLESKLRVVGGNDIFINEDNATLISKCNSLLNEVQALQKQRSKDKKTIDYLLSKLNFGGK